MSAIWWNLSGTDNRCHTYGAGHWVHWIQYKLSVRRPGPIIPVIASVADDGALLLQGDGLLLQCWNHRPELVRAALLRCVGIAQWKPDFHLLVVPTGDLVDGASNVFSLGGIKEKRKCRVIHVTNPDHLVPRAPSPTNVPPLRPAKGYAAGRPRPSAKPRESGRP